MISKADYAIVIRCAEQYEKELLDTNVLFVYENRRTKKYESVEVTFLASNFKHLTGVIYPHNDKEEADEMSEGAVHFFNLALRKRLNINKCNYKSDGTTPIKLQILSSIMNIKKTARMIGDYNNSRLHIMADKMCGSTSATLAFTRSGSNELLPSSTLREDIRRLVTEYHTVIAVYQKSIQDREYANCFYTSKKYSISKLPKSIKEKLKEEPQ